MSTPLLVDSNYYISRARRGLDPFAELARAGDEWEIATCGMIQFEVLRGISNLAVRNRFEDAFAVMQFIPTTNAIWDRAWRLAWSMDRAGQLIPPQDTLIAAHALQANGAVLTADRHFLLVPELPVFGQLD